MADLGWTQHTNEEERQHLAASIREAAFDLYDALHKIVTELEDNDHHNRYGLTPEQMRVAKAALERATG